MTSSALTDNNSTAYICAVESLTPQRLHETQKEKRPVVKRLFFREFADQLELEHTRPRVPDATTTWKEESESSSWTACSLLTAPIALLKNKNFKSVSLSSAPTYLSVRSATGLGCLTESLCISSSLLFSSEDLLYASKPKY